MEDFLAYSRLQDSAVHRSWLRERVVAIYIFAWLVFATSLLSERRVRYSWQKVFWKVLSSLPQGKMCKSVEKNFYLFFIQSLIDMTEIFNMIYRWLSFSGLPNSLGPIVSGETSAIFSLVLGVLSCPVVRAKSGKRRESESLSLTSHLTSRERLGLRLSYFLRIRVHCCCCRRCYCCWCLLSCWGRAKSQGRLVTRYLGISIKRV